ncbi:hypothetical protein HF324_20875 [Chitinophaga oryzae]|uniref:Uncharacterized protein n=1 Tax=Chitinophaga oryzae TaxID=2725414 RepID=A0ABX6LMZ7_9BACT|nr:hypothetical protein [Chitinophaga oryzae]QJB40179.1 hypothetical protein HF324_20875 [Chitinophaga oryzae]
MTKPVVSKILEKKPINEIEINTLLDWLDKIRIGLWLGSLLLEKTDDFERNFHIKQRMGASDRLVAISFINDLELGINYTGTGFLTFRASPSCFTLCINNITLFNFSKEFCFSKRLGLPAPSKKLFIPGDNRILSELEPGNNRVMLPIIRVPFWVKSIKLYQSIINPIEGEISDKLKTQYYSEIIQDKKSKIFIENDFTGESHFLKEILSFDLINEYSRADIFNRIALQTIRFQNYSIEKLAPSPENLSREEQRAWRKYAREIVHLNEKHIHDLNLKITNHRHSSNLP